MLKSFIMIISIITTGGDLQMKAFDVDVCPELKEFRETMDGLKKQGEIIDWNAMCIARNAPTEEL